VEVKVQTIWIPVHKVYYVPREHVQDMDLARIVKDVLILLKGGKLPPIRVVAEGDGWHRAVNGRHRWVASMIAGHYNVLAEVEFASGEDRDETEAPAEVVPAT
jgi:hypothetical protein